jgi:hypothetical protein
MRAERQEAREQRFHSSTLPDDVIAQRDAMFVVVNGISRLSPTTKYSSGPSLRGRISNGSGTFCKVLRELCRPPPSFPRTNSIVSPGRPTMRFMSSRSAGQAVKVQPKAHKVMDEFL